MDGRGGVSVDAKPHYRIERDPHNPGYYCAMQAFAWGFTNPDDAAAFIAKRRERDLAEARCKLLGETAEQGQIVGGHLDGQYAPTEWKDAPVREVVLPSEAHLDAGRYARNLPPEPTVPLLIDRYHRMTLARPAQGKRVTVWIHADRLAEFDLRR